MTRPHTLLVLLALLPLGCSFSYSSDSSVKTLTSPFRSSGSSADDDSKEAYREDVRDFTYAYVAARGDPGEFPRGLGDLARRHGVSNWEERDATYVAVGAGLAKAQMTATELDLFERTLCHDDPLKTGRIRHGFDAYGGGSGAAVAMPSFAPPRRR